MPRNWDAAAVPGDPPAHGRNWNVDLVPESTNPQKRAWADEQAAPRGRNWATDSTSYDSLAAGPDGNKNTDQGFAGFQLSDLSGYTSPEETIKNFTQKDKDRINEYGPAAVAGAAGLLLPGSPVVAALGSMVLGTAARAATPWLKGEGADAVIEATNAPGSLLLEGTLPFVGKAIAAGLKAAPLSRLADFVDVTRLDAPLRNLSTVVESVGPAAMRDMTLAEKVRSGVSAPARLLMRSSSEAARNAGDRIEEFGALERFLRVNGKRVIKDAFAGLKNPELRDQITHVLTGDLAEDAVAPEVARAAKMLRDEFYGPLGNLAKRAGVMTQSKETGGMVPFETISEFYSPQRLTAEAAERLRRMGSGPAAQFRRRLMGAQQRVGGDQEWITDAHDLATKYLDEFSEKIAASHAFGSQAEAGKWGGKAVDLLDNLRAENRPLEAALFEQTLNRVYAPLKLSPLEQGIRGGTSQLSKLLLGRASLRSIPQQATNVMRAGVGNTIEGLTRYATDPSFRELVKRSGAMDPGFLEHATDLGASPRAIPARLMGAVERALRGVGNAGAIPQTEKLVAAVESARNAGKMPSAAVMRQLDELRIPISSADEGMTADLLSKAFQRSSDINQYHAHALGQVGDVFHDPIPKAATQFQPYGWAAWRNLQDSVLEPIASGIKNRAPSDVLLGAGRAARWVPLTALLSAPVTALYAKSSGRDLKEGDVGRDVLDALAGPVGGMVSHLPGGWPRDTDHPLSAALQAAVKQQMQAPPAASVLTQWATNPESIPLDVAAMLDPTGALAVLRAPLQAGVKERFR